MTDFQFPLPKEEYMYPGHSACPGCGEPISMRMLLKALGPDTIMNVPAGCCAVIPGVWPTYSLKIPLIDHAFECTGAVSSGIRAALDHFGKEDVTVVGWAGDGGTADIGLQSLSGGVDRGTDMLYIMYDNEAYMNTGNQCSSATPCGANTTTTPGGKSHQRTKKDVMKMMIANGIVYGASLNPAFPEDFMEKVVTAKGIRGPKFLHILSPCPSGWKFDPRNTIKIARLATETGVFPLYEYRNGETIFTKDLKNRKPLEEYLRLQGRFKHLSQADVEGMQRVLDESIQKLLKEE